MFPLCAALLVFLAACSAPSAAPSAPDDAGAATSSPATAEAVSRAPETPAPQSITLAFAGDVHFERQVAGLLEHSDESWGRKLPELRDADFAMVNLETALGGAGSPAPKPFTFQTPAVALDKLRAGGVDAVTMANNHAVDHGRAGLVNTLGIIENHEMPVVGLGRDATEAFAPIVTDIDGVDTAILASSHIAEWTSQYWAASTDSAGIATDLDPTRLRSAVRAAASAHDLVVVFMHWGIEGSNCPSQVQTERVEQLKQDGADIIVGTHAHRLQGNGWSGRTFVGYGLGNFIWYNSAPDSRRSGVLTVTVDADAARARGASRSPTKEPLVTDFTWTPKRIAGDGEPMSVTGAEREDVVAAMNRALSCSGLAPEQG